MPVSCLPFGTVPPADADEVNVSTGPSVAGQGMSVDELRSIGLSAGLDRVGVCDAAILERARRELHRRKSTGLADSMQFTFRNPERSTDPTRTVTGARSIIVGARNYHRTDDGPESAAPNVSEPRARIARYAQEDHYSALRSGLEVIAAVLRARGHRAVVVADENNLVDREVAYRAGLGWFGKNANLLLPGAGSWFVLGSVVTDADLGPSPAAVSDGCGSCRRCLDACPTGAIVADGVIDARKCLAWLVQKPGEFPREHRIALGDRLYGCDDCQDSCPITVRLGSRNSGPPDDTESRSDHDRIGASVSVLDVLEADDAELLARFGRWYIPERNPIWVRRNALIILGNVAPIPVTPRTASVLETYAQSANPYLRAQTLWTAHRLGVDAIVTQLASDEDPVVRAEFDHVGRTPRRDQGDTPTGRS